MIFKFVLDVEVEAEESYEEEEGSADVVLDLIKSCHDRRQRKRNSGGKVATLKKIYFIVGVYSPVWTRFLSHL